MTKDLTSKIVDYLATLAPGSIVSRDVVAAKTGLSDRQAYYAMYRLISLGTISVETLSRGKTWKLLSVGAVADGDAEVPVDDGMLHLEVIENAWPIMIVRDGDGQLYTLKMIGQASA